MLGHARDPIHPFSDAGMLAGEMPGARLVVADSLVELRMRPERLTGEIAAFLDEVWSSDGTGSTRRASGKGSRRSSRSGTGAKRSAAAQQRGSRAARAKA